MRYQIYEKVPKTKEYMQGSRLIENEENPFKEGPCLLCIAAVEALDKSVFGVTKQGMRMARLRVRGEKNAGFDLGSFPVKFLSMKLNTRDEVKMSYEERIQSFVTTYLLPLVSNNGQRLDCIQAMRQMRNVNILSYCDGTVTVQNIEKCLVNKMQELGYTSEEIAKIQSQMCMFPIATNRLEGKQKSTCISFKDINDDEVADDITPEIAESIQKSPIGEGIFKYSDNELAYYMSSNGAHTIKAYMSMGRALPACLSSIISKALKNSISNADKTKEFIPVTAQLLTEDCMSIMLAAEQGISAGELLNILDEGLKYGDARRLSELEMRLLDQLDESYDAQVKSSKELQFARQSLENERVILGKTDKAIEENCSEVTRLKILASRGYQLGKKEREAILHLQSDREVLGDRENELRTFNKDKADMHLKKAGDLQESVAIAKELDAQIAILASEQEK